MTCEKFILNKIFGICIFLAFTKMNTNINPDDMYMLIYFCMKKQTLNKYLIL